ncbi:hypothetical protein [Poriferisphaera sp. WC338]|uniref:hypothetical protein n=1 Tax=Poriferisphaera sp. WC338 TaxID=3425129 RepID=UPI003D81A943
MNTKKCLAILFGLALMLGLGGQAAMACDTCGCSDKPAATQPSEGHDHSDKDHGHKHAEKKKCETCAKGEYCEKCEKKKAAAEGEKSKCETCAAGKPCTKCDAKKAAKAKGEKTICDGETCEKCEPVGKFEQVGVVQSLRGFFDAESKSAHEHNHDESGEALVDLILVTEKGVYHFIETPSNKAALSEIKPGDVIAAKGKIYNSGSMLFLDEAKLVEGKQVDVSKFKSAKGKEVELVGVNGCQCQLKMADLPHSCKLGHLHHLQDTKGNIYNYIPTGSAQELIKGKGGTHGQQVKVKATLLPGNTLEVKKAETVKKSEG